MTCFAIVTGVLGSARSGSALRGPFGSAVFNATGERVRDFPITLDNSLPGLPNGNAKVASKLTDVT